MSKNKKMRMRSSMRSAIITEIELRGKRTDPYRVKEESKGIKSPTVKIINMRIGLSKERATLKIMMMDPLHSSKAKL